MSEKEFVNLKNGDEMSFSIIVKPKEEDKPKKEPLSIEVNNFLEKFSDIVSDGSPIPLPPNREINHQINFMLGNYLPHKVAYKMTPDQNKEI